ncbi:hypothetical protein BS78_06G023500 [Paspalum vaginatum]|nr:hypothetical protein BS78_06G023500 [Paspalum vaginatum]
MPIALSSLLFAAHGAPRLGGAACPHHHRCHGSCFLVATSSASLTAKRCGCRMGCATTTLVASGFSCREVTSCFLMNPFTKATMPLPALCSYTTYTEPVEAFRDPFAQVLEMTWKYCTDISKIYVQSLAVCSTRLIAAVISMKGLDTSTVARQKAFAVIARSQGCRQFLWPPVHKTAYLAS